MRGDIYLGYQVLSIWLSSSLLRRPHLHNQQPTVCKETLSYSQLASSRSRHSDRSTVSSSSLFRSDLQQEQGHCMKCRRIFTVNRPQKSVTCILQVQRSVCGHPNHPTMSYGEGRRLDRHSNMMVKKAIPLQNDLLLPKRLRLISTQRTSQSCSQWTTSKCCGLTLFTWKLCESPQGQFRRNMLKESILRQLTVLSLTFSLWSTAFKWSEVHGTLLESCLEIMASRRSNLQFR